MKIKHILLLSTICLITSFLGAYIYKTFFNTPEFQISYVDNSTPYKRVNNAAIENLETGFITA